MKKAQWFAVALSASLMVALVGCQSPSDGKSSTPTPTPTSTKYKATIDFPKSMTAKSSATGSFAANVARGARGLSADVSADPPPTSMAYSQVKEAMDQLVTQAKANATNGILLNAIISQNNLSPSDATRSGLNVTITQALADAMKDAMPESAQGDLDTASMVGQLMPIPDFVYKASENANFDVQIAMSFPADMGGGTVTFYWKSDLSRTAMSFETSGNKGVMAYDAVTNSAFMSFTSTDFEFKVSGIVDSATKTAHGAFLSQTFKDTTQGFDGSMTAYGDDSGGEVINSFTQEAQGEQPASTGIYTEGFSGTGILTFQELGSDVDYGTITETYNAKLTPVPTDFGKASSFFP